MNRTYSVNESRFIKGIPSQFVLFAFVVSASFADTFHDSRNQPVTVPFGRVAFADAVVANSYDPLYAGGPAPTNEKFLDPGKAIGAPDYTGGGNGTGAVSLGRGGRIALEFVNNVLIASGDTNPDLYIFEVGPDVEKTEVEISADGNIWISVGSVAGSSSSIDIDAFGISPSQSFRFVRLTDDPNSDEITGDTVGADIDAVAVVSGHPTLETPSLRIARIGADQFELSFPSQVGQTYYIQYSSNLRSWTTFNSVDIQGDGNLYRVVDTTSEPCRFYRLIRTK